MSVKHVEGSAHHHDVRVEELQGARLAVIKAVEKTHLHKHDNHSERYRRDRDEHRHLVMNDVPPCQRRPARADPDPRLAVFGRHH